MDIYDYFNQFNFGDFLPEYEKFYTRQELVNCLANLYETIKGDMYRLQAQEINRRGNEINKLTEDFWGAVVNSLGDK